MNDREVRDLMTGVELRCEPRADGKGPGVLTGYAAVFGPVSSDLGGFVEKIDRGAFREAIARDDVRALVNHKPDALIGRNKAGTLRMIEDEIGLRYEVDLPDTHLGREVAELVRRGDLDGSSFSFTIPKGGDAWDRSGAVPLRTVRAVDRLFDVGPVAYPAYTDTRVAMRSLGAASAAEPPAVPVRLIAARLRLAEAV